MADKNFQMTQRNSDNTAWDNLFPKTKAEQVVVPGGGDLGTALYSTLLQRASIASNQDWNQIQQTGIYSFGVTSGMTNHPNIGDWGVLNVYVANNGYLIQEAFQVVNNAINRIYRTRTESGAWSPWNRVLTKTDYDTLFQYANDGKTAVANAVTAKGVSASSSDTFTALATKIGQIARGQGNAVESQVLQGITFSNADGVLRTGVMTNRLNDQPASTTWTNGSGNLSVGFPTGAYVTNSGFGAGIASVTINDPNFISTNLLEGKSYFGLSGSMINLSTRNGARHQALQAWTGGGTSIYLKLPQGYSDGVDTHVYYDEPNLIPSNIVSGKSVFGVTGSYNKPYGVGDFLTYDKLGQTSLITQFYNSPSYRILCAVTDGDGNMYAYVYGSSSYYACKLNSNGYTPWILDNLSSTRYGLHFANGYLYVLSDGLVRKLNKDTGAVINTSTAMGYDPSYQMCNAITSDANGNILVCTSANGRVIKFNSNLGTIGAIDLMGAPTHIYGISWAGNKIYVYMGTFISRINDDFTFPTNAANLLSNDGGVVAVDGDVFYFAYHNGSSMVVEKRNSAGTTLASATIAASSGRIRLVKTNSYIYVMCANLIKRFDYNLANATTIWQWPVTISIPDLTYNKVLDEITASFMVSPSNSESGVALRFIRIFKITA